MPTDDSNPIEEIGFRASPGVRQVLELAAGAQDLREKLSDRVKRARTRKVTRTAALWAAGELDPEIRRSLQEEGLDPSALAALVGIEQLVDVVPRSDFQLHADLRAALLSWHRRNDGPAMQDLDTRDLVGAILYHVELEPERGRLPKRLRELGVDASTVDLFSWVAVPEPALQVPKHGPTTPAMVFVSYSHEDKDWVQRLRRHLAPYVDRKVLTVFSDDRLEPGNMWRHELHRMREQSSVAILVLSPAFQRSPTIREIELPHLQALATGRKKLSVLPLLVRDPNWNELGWIRDILFFPRSGQPLESLDFEQQEILLGEFAEWVAKTASAAASAAPDPVPSEERAPLDPAARADDYGRAATGKRRERVPSYRDDPARVDELNRRPFADVLAMRMQEIWDSSEENPEDPGHRRSGQSFAVHIHGPWGSGKTSVLNFLREGLQERTEGRDPWVVVEFNAWRNQRVRPPWWSLIREVYRQSIEQLAARKRWRLRWHWWSWRFRADWLPALLAGLVLALLILLVGGAVGLFESDAATGQPPDWGGRLETALKILATLLAAGAGATALGRSLLLGSAKAAQSYMELRGDPMGPVAGLFEALARGVQRPLAVFVDDLDRCDGGYVVDLLEGVQTLFRRAKVSYVVAADREWIRTSFEERYKGFAGTIAKPGRPLGHLFLEKLFQVSAAVPSLSADTRGRYWVQLVEGASTESADGIEEMSRRAEEHGEELLGDAIRQEEIQRVIEEHSGLAAEAGIRAAAAKRIATPEAREETEHFLAPFAPLIEPNPRAMKRLVNDYGIRQAVGFLEGRTVEAGPLVRWTILCLRWPLLADLLAAHPDLVGLIGAREAPTDPRIPEPLTILFTRPSVIDVVQGDGFGAQVPVLSPEALQQIAGTFAPATPESGADSSDRISS